MWSDDFRSTWGRPRSAAQVFESLPVASTALDRTEPSSHLDHFSAPSLVNIPTDEIPMARARQRPKTDQWVRNRFASQNFRKLHERSPR